MCIRDRCETPANSPASRHDPVKSNASNMFMISSTDFTVSLLGRFGASAPLTAPQEGPQPRDAVRQTDSCRADLMTASGQVSCPPPGSFVAVSGQFLVSAVIDSTTFSSRPPQRHQHRNRRGVGGRRYISLTVASYLGA